jgi:hypothetical protein
MVKLLITQSDPIMNLLYTLFCKYMIYIYICGLTVTCGPTHTHTRMRHGGRGAARHGTATGGTGAEHSRARYHVPDLPPPETASSDRVTTQTSALLATVAHAPRRPPRAPTPRPRPPHRRA